MLYTVKAIRAWKSDRIIIVESEAGDCYLAIESGIPCHAQPGLRVRGNLVQGIVRMQSVYNEPATRTIPIKPIPPRSS